MAFINLQDLHEELDQLTRVWSANPDFKLKTHDLEQFGAKVAAFAALRAEIAAQDDAQVTERNALTAQAAELSKIAVRARAGIKGYFGDDSDEYELAGGTPASKRKKRARESQDEIVALKAA